MSALDRLRNDSKKLRDTSFADLLAVAKESGEILDAAQAGDGYTLVKSAADKRHFVGVPVLIEDWKLQNTGSFGDGTFVTAHLRTEFPVAALGGATRFILNDGSTGIAKQLMELRNDGFTGVLLCRKGFSRSEYEVKDPVTKEPVLDPVSGKAKVGVTYYLDNSA